MLRASVQAALDRSRRAAKALPRPWIVKTSASAGGCAPTPPAPAAPRDPAAARERAVALGWLLAGSSLVPGGRLVASAAAVPRARPEARGWPDARRRRTWRASWVGRARLVSTAPTIAGDASREPSQDGQKASREASFSCHRIDQSVTWQELCVTNGRVTVQLVVAARLWPGWKPPWDGGALSAGMETTAEVAADRGSIRTTPRNKRCTSVRGHPEHRRARPSRRRSLRRHTTGIERTEPWPVEIVELAERHAGRRTMALLGREHSEHRRARHSPRRRLPGTRRASSEQSPGRS
jgi:hypothetical protein